MKQPKDYLALAIDNTDDLATIESLVAQTAPYIGTFKIGFEQFVRFGPPVLDVVKKHGAKIFLDLKLHDIPNTVGKAVEAAAAHEVDILTVHASGGSEMLKAAGAAAAKAKHPPKIVAVTVLTSISEEALNGELGVAGKLSDQVANLAKLAANAGLSGIVCSAADLAFVKQGLPAGFEIVTPGIRPAGVDAGDQKRIATPREAIDGGSTLLVLGRAVTAAADPAAAAKAILESIS